MSPHQRLCTRYIDITEKITEVTKVFCTILIIILALSPIAYYLIAGVMMPTMPIYFPDTNYEMFNNFILIAFVHSVVLLSGLCMFYAYDTLLIVIFVNMLMVASIIVEDINELDCVLNKHKYAVKEPRQRLIKIIWMQKKIGG